LQVYLLTFRLLKFVYKLLSYQIYKLIFSLKFNLKEVHSRFQNLQGLMITNQNLELP